MTATLRRRAAVTAAVRRRAAVITAALRPVLSDVLPPILLTWWLFAGSPGLTWAEEQEPVPVPGPADAAFLLAVLAPLLLRRRAAVPVLLWLLAVVLLTEGWWSGPLVTYFPAITSVLVAIYTVAVQRPLLTSLLLALAAAALSFAPLSEGETFPPDQGADGTALQILWWLLPWYVGVTVRLARRRAAESRAAEAEATERAAAEQARAHEEAVLTDARARVRRDLDEHVVPRVAAMVADARSARSAADTDPATARLALERIAGTGSATLEDMRRLLDALRHQEGDPTERPRPDTASDPRLGA